MANLLSDAQKTAFGDALNNCFDTFARPITIWKQGDTVIVASNEDQFNFIYGNTQPSITTTLTPVSGVFQGSISWGTPGDFDQKEIRPDILGTLCQLDLLDDGYNFLSGYNQIIVDGVSCSLSPNHPYPRRHGLFDTRYKCLYLRANN